MNMMTVLDRARRAALLGAAVLMVACIAPAGVSPSDSGSPTLALPSAPTLAASPSADEDCLSSVLHEDGPPETIEYLSNQMAVILVGTLEGFGTPYWSTPDGQRPPVDARKEEPFTLYTPVKVNVAGEGEIKGTRPDAEGAVVWGGQLGCDIFTEADGPQLSVGSRYVFFFYESTNNGEPFKRLMTAWPIGPNNEVNAPHEGARPLGQAIRELRSGKPEGPQYSDPSLEPPIDSGRP